MVSKLRFFRTQRRSTSGCFLGRRCVLQTRAVDYEGEAAVEGVVYHVVVCVAFYTNSALPRISPIIFLTSAISFSLSAFSKLLYPFFSLLPRLCLDHHDQDLWNALLDLHCKSVGHSCWEGGRRLWACSGRSVRWSTQETRVPHNAGACSVL